jgi:hypothetical protein
MCAKLAYSDCNVLRLICQRTRPEEPSIDELPPQLDYARTVPAIWKTCTFTRARHPGRGRPGQATPRPAWLDMRNAKQHAKFWQSGKHVHQIVARTHYLNVHILSSSSWQICLQVKTNAVEIVIYSALHAMASIALAPSSCGPVPTDCGGRTASEMLQRSIRGARCCSLRRPALLRNLGTQRRVVAFAMCCILNTHNTD